MAHQDTTDPAFEWFKIYVTTRPWQMMEEMRKDLRAVFPERDVDGKMMQHLNRMRLPASLHQLGVRQVTVKPDGSGRIECTDGTELTVGPEGRPDVKGVE